MTNSLVEVSEEDGCVFTGVSDGILEVEMVDEVVEIDDVVELDETVTPLWCVKWWVGWEHVTGNDEPLCASVAP